MPLGGRVRAVWGLENASERQNIVKTVCACVHGGLGCVEVPGGAVRRIRVVKGFRCEPTGIIGVEELKQRERTGIREGLGVIKWIQNHGRLKCVLMGLQAE